MSTASRPPVWVPAVLFVAAVLASLWWARQGQPVELVAAPGGRVQCVSYAPSSRRDETLVNPGVIVEPERIEQDLKLLAERFDCVRTYSQSNGLDEVPRIARGLGLKVLMGVWLGRDEVMNRREVESAIRIAERDRDVLRGIVVGNEVLLRGELPPTALASYIEQVRAATGLPVTYADVWEFWVRYRAPLESAVDFLTIHILPYWEDEPVAVEQAVDHIRDIYTTMQAEFPGREILIGETGWPSAGRQRQGAVPSVVNQARFIREFLAFTANAGIPYNVIEAFDQPWKRRQEGAVGGYWGLYDNERGEKFSLIDPVVEEARWPLALGIGVIVAVLFFLAARVSGWRGGLLAQSVVLLSGYTTACVLASQARMLWLASRSLQEWIIGGVWTGLSLATAWWLSRALADTSAASLKGWRLLRFLWLFSATIVSLLLVLDSRYRDFPLALFLPPVVALLLLRQVRPETQESLLKIEEKLLAGWLVVAALVTPLIEGVLNTQAWCWALLCLLFGLGVLLPQRSRKPPATL